MESCPTCGKDSPGNSLHCVHCGAKLTSAAQKTQFGMPVLRPDAAKAAEPADDGEKSTAEYAPQDLARLAMATKKTPGSALAGLGSLKKGRRPGSLLQGLPQFRGAGSSPLTSGEFRLGSLGNSAKGDADGEAETADEPEKPKLGIYAGATRSSLPPEIAPSVTIAATEPGPTVAMQGVTDAQLAEAAAPADAPESPAAGEAEEPAATVAMQGVTDSDLTAADAPADAPAEASAPDDRTVEERAVRPKDVTEVDAPAQAEAPLPAAMRGSERAHHPSKAGVQQARVAAESGSNTKWIILGLIVAAGVGIAIWLTQG